MCCSQVATSKKIGLIPAAKLPKRFDQLVDILWTASVVMHILFIFVRIQRLDPGAKKYLHQRRVLLVNFAKFWCDLGQSLPAAAQWESPALFDTLCGLTSGFLSTYKCYLEQA
jgi:hypothetical protein